MPIGARLREYREKKHYKVAEFASIIGISQGTLSDIENEKTKPSAETIAAIVRHTDINATWLLTGRTTEKESYMYRAPAERSMIIAEQPAEFMKSDAVSVTVHALGGAGMGKMLVETDPIETIAVPREFWKPSIQVVKVRGDSMEDYIHDGAFVGIDTHDREILSGRIYAIWLPYDGTVLKEIYTTPSDIVFKSRNARYPVFSVPLKEFQTENIIGRVKWVLQEV
ncbi:MAG: LexA family transcriptional regulator [Nitrospirota bacterium]